MTACLSRPIGWSVAIVLGDIVHDASHVDQEKRDARFSFCMHACGAVPMIMVLRLAAEGPWQLRYYILHVSPNGLKTSKTTKPFYFAYYITHHTAKNKFNLNKQKNYSK